jgi:2,4-dienoyl-CoA reductase-like NADH-dependent reductase (Old Yellow Enzyme family)
MGNKSSFNNLLQPGRIGTMELKNRIIMAPMGNGFCTQDGFVTERMTSFYRERAQGGVGLIIVGVVCVDHPRGLTEPCQLGISDDKFIPSLSELVKVIHQDGAKICLQMHHGGHYSFSQMTGEQPVSSSPIPLKPDLEMPRVLTVEEIGQIVEFYAQAAERAQKAGFDAIEIHAAHGYLIDQFLIPDLNTRQDDYGGNLDNRARFLLEIVRAVRERVGKDYPVWCRMNGRTFGYAQGITIEDAQKLARMVEQAGVDAIHVSGHGGNKDTGFLEAPLVQPPGNLLPAAEAIKKVVNVPVIAVGRIGIERAEEFLREGNADFIAMGRPLLADPELPNKLATGQVEDVRSCICCYSCVHQNFLAQSIICAVNAAMGREREFRIEPVSAPKKVLVVGGGPAGMEAARVASMRGHQVTLCEKEPRLGGSLFFAAMARRENEDLINYLAGQLKKLRVDVRLGREVTQDMVAELKPDAVIVAVGPDYPDLDVPGADGNTVIGSAQFRQMLSGHLDGDARKKLNSRQRMALGLGSPLVRSSMTPEMIRRLTKVWMPLGKRVVIMGGDLVGCELAEFLAERGRKVTVLETGASLASEMEMSIPLAWLIVEHLQEKGVAMLTEVNYEEITSNGVTITDKDGQRRTFQADTVVLATGVKPNLKLYEAITAMVSETRGVGDCMQLRFIKGSIADGASAAMAI